MLIINSHPHGRVFIKSEKLKGVDSLFLLLRFSLNEPKGESVISKVA